MLKREQMNFFKIILKKIIYKEVAKNLVGQDIHAIEQSVFK